MISPEKTEYYAKKNEKKNYRFRTWLKINADPDDFDARCKRLHDELFADYDCSQCRRCCRHLYATVPLKDISADAAYLGMSEEEFVEKYLEPDDDIDSSDEEYRTKHMPCDFLNEDGSCVLGDHKPQSCVKYPYTDQPDRVACLLSFIDTLAVCPVSYEIWERLKEEYEYSDRRAF